MGKVDIINLLRDIVREEGIGTYLVGGYVRDKILGIDNKDIDITVEGNAKRIAELLSNRLGVGIKRTSQFGTYILFASAYRIDIATARSEQYPSPGTLPLVEPGGILEDLSRRDFTVNSMAVPIGTDTVIDLFNGLNDLKKRLIRVLHGKSFSEDPTRIFRALRFAERMDFQIEKITMSLIEEAIEKGFLSKVSTARIRNELTLCLMEKKRWDLLNRIAKLGIFKQLGMVYPGRNFLQELEEFAKKFMIEPESLYFIAFADGGKNRNFLTKKETKFLNSIKTLYKKIPCLKKKEKREDIFTILEGFPHPSLIYIGVKMSIREKISLYLEEIEPVRLEITGNDIRGMGISNGKEIGEILRSVKRKRLSSSLSSKEDEMNYVKEILKKNQDNDI